ncbi:hypothetical protein [Alteribacter populi]|nr:hypothetical protein [Alteribacter populi]
MSKRSKSKRFPEQSADAVAPKNEKVVRNDKHEQRSKRKGP